MLARTVTPFQRPQFKLLGQSPESDQSPIRSLPHLLRFNAACNPNHLFCLQTKPSEDGFDVPPTQITFTELKEAVGRCSRWIKAKVADIMSPVLTKSGVIQKGPPIALFLESDVSLFMYLMALLSINVPVSTSQKTLTRVKATLIDRKVRSTVYPS